MRRYRLRLRPVCALESAAIWWDSKARHYVCALSQPDGQVRYETYEHLREAIYWQGRSVIFDDRLLRALLKDRANSASTKAHP